MPGIDQDERQIGQAADRVEPLADAAQPGGPALEADRDIGAEREAELAQPIGRPVEAEQGRARPRSVAAASAEPPPMPLATGRCFSRRMATSGRPAGGLGECRAARMTRLSGSGRERRRRAR